jgi:DNA-binding transcriptional MocR family regulator/CheY-like chemotaxis protein
VTLGRRARVLVVEDDAAVRLALRLVLDEHHDVLEAAHGSAALEMLERHHVDVVILDLLLPEGDGFQVLQRIRTLPRRVPVVVVSALNTSWTAATAMRLGAVDYITKPFDDAQVLTAVAESLDALPADRAFGDRQARVLCVGVPVGVRATLSILFGSRSRVDATDDVRTALDDLAATPVDAVVVDAAGAAITRLREVVPTGRLLPLARPVSFAVLVREVAAAVGEPRHRWFGFDETTWRTLDALGEHFGEITVERLAQTMRMAPSALAARFRRDVGTPLRTYLLTLRLEIAKTLLAGSTRSLADIAARVGWHDASHLSRIFVANVGCRPGVYRRRHRRDRFPVTDAPPPTMPARPTWTSLVDPPVRPRDPFASFAAGARGAERVAFDLGECTGELRPRRFFTEVMAEASTDSERLGYAGVGTPIDAFSEAVGVYLGERGVALRDAGLLTTSGTSASVAILARALASAGDVVAVEHPTWPVALAAFAAADLRVLGIPVDDRGLRVDLLEAALRRHRARFVYVQPTFQNPTGVSLSASRRSELLALARAFDTLIVEDDFAAELAYQDAPAPLRADEGADRVVYLKSFSKLLAPALRVAVMVAPRAHLHALRTAQHGLDPFPSAMAQSVVARCLATPEFRQHVERIRGLLDARWQVMNGALQTHMPEGVRWTVPRGGLCTWLDLPEPLTAPELLTAASRFGVGFSPGSLFCLDGSGQRGARLAFGATPPMAIERGVRRLARAIRGRLGGPERGEPTIRAC